MIFHLISSPRTVSTSLMYSFYNRMDTAAVDEPFYAYYLAQTNKDHPGRQAVMNEMSANPQFVLQQLKAQDEYQSYLFVKNMAHHMIDLPTKDFADFHHIFLIRNPRRVIASIAKILTPLTLLDIGVQEQWNIYNRFIQAGLICVVVDSTEILKNPKSVLQQLCEELNIPFDTNMLTWQSGPRDIDGSWADYWYANTHKSTGFGEFNDRPVKLNSNLDKLFQTSLTYYEQLWQHSIHV